MAVALRGIHNFTVRRLPARIHLPYFGPPCYDLEMDENSPPPLWKVLFGASVVTIVAFGLPIGEFIGNIIGPDKMFAVIGIAIGVAGIWSAVRWLNEREDPSNQRRPPDHP